MPQTEERRLDFDLEEQEEQDEDWVWDEHDNVEVPKSTIPDGYSYEEECEACQ